MADSINKILNDIFKNFTVNSKAIPVSFLRYTGNSTTYITYMESDKDNSYSGDDELLGYVTYYDFDIYSKGNYLEIMEKVKEVLKETAGLISPLETLATFTRTIRAIIIRLYVLQYQKRR